jgi:hypothetical protein
VTVTCYFRCKIIPCNALEVKKAAAVAVKVTDMLGEDVLVVKQAQSGNVHTATVGSPSPVCR